jgi:hypothetical protein
VYRCDYLGASDKLAGNDPRVQTEILEMIHDGVTIVAFIDCVDNYNVTERLEKLGIKGFPLTE